ncbi:MAG: hypothetical protein COV91_04750 [Candidatus Taylorbacteria bacterium CG11_big_fil_rev_8_21_14_0_20_46_11]|uniref:Uncharacterized protein n=1 Tax=Candidatus Taylorbacteria bacterium CG11_big_fil_rev_8_21_14_0_20_46_11 TaxID=1975025 RepID=A0A2H0KAR4_9BACT|nr:MAG: hypothetical protein COV91_04750 [Candidatus Taylorbacteria bacterium CG11_big_fil_rev_8_21_14_0_20_46_11]
MLPKKKRLHSEDFIGFKGSRTVHTPHFIFRWKKGETSTRIVAIVATSVAKQAVERNKLRRRVYEATATSTEVLPQVSLLSITAKKGASGISFLELTKEIHSGFIEIRAQK